MNPQVTVWSVPGSGKVDFLVQMPNPETVNINIYEISGKMASRIQRYDLRPGLNRFTWNTRRDNAGLKPGIYICRIEGNGWQFASKLLYSN
jgi:flagellar hook assembly protein FlgD